MLSSFHSYFANYSMLFMAIVLSHILSATIWRRQITNIWKCEENTGKKSVYLENEKCPHH